LIEVQLELFYDDGFSIGVSISCVGYDDGFRNVISISIVGSRIQECDFNLKCEIPFVGMGILECASGWSADWILGF
jgi:hypothetical protein